MVRSVSEGPLVPLLSFTALVVSIPKLSFWVYLFLILSFNYFFPYFFSPATETFSPIPLAAHFSEPTVTLITGGANVRTSLSSSSFHQFLNAAIDELLQGPLLFPSSICCFFSLLSQQCRYKP